MDDGGQTGAVLDLSSQKGRFVGHTTQHDRGQQSGKNIDAKTIVAVSFGAKKLATLLFFANMPETVREKLITIFETLTMEELAELADILEERFLDDSTKVFDRSAEQELNTIVATHEKALREQEQALIEEINSIKP